MNIRLTLILVAMFYAHFVNAQDGYIHQTTTVPSTSRYEIVQSPLLARLAFKLDRHTGDTWQFVETGSGNFAWQEVTRIYTENDERKPNQTNYQIFMSSIRAQVTILMNTNTGVSWVIAEDPKEGIFWSAFEE